MNVEIRSAIVEIR